MDSLPGNQPENLFWTRVAADNAYVTPLRLRQSSPSFNTIWQTGLSCSLESTATENPRFENAV